MTLFCTILVFLSLIHSHSLLASHSSVASVVPHPVTSIRLPFLPQAYSPFYYWVTPSLSYTLPTTPCFSLILGVQSQPSHSLPAEFLSFLFLTLIPTNLLFLSLPQSHLLSSLPFRVSSPSLSSLSHTYPPSLIRLPFFPLFYSPSHSYH